MHGETASSASVDFCFCKGLYWGTVYRDMLWTLNRSTLNRQIFLYNSGQLALGWWCSEKCKPRISFDAFLFVLCYFVLHSLSVVMCKSVEVTPGRHQNMARVCELDPAMDVVLYITICYCFWTHFENQTCCFSPFFSLPVTMCVHIFSRYELSCSYIYTGIYWINIYHVHGHKWRDRKSVV